MAVRDIESQKSRSQTPKDGQKFRSTFFLTPVNDPFPKSDQPAFPTLGNPGPLGLSAFALTTMVLSLVNVQARSVANPHITIGLGILHRC